MDFLEEILEHSWGTSPQQKKREKEYNAEYYQNNKDKWKNRPRAREKNVGGSGSIVSKYSGRSKRHADFQNDLADYRELRGWRSSIYDDPVYKNRSLSDIEANRDLYQKAMREIYNKNKSRQKESSETIAKNERNKSLKNYYLNELKKDQAAQQKSKAKKAREFIDGVVSEAIDTWRLGVSTIKSSKKGKTFISEFFGLS